LARAQLGIGVRGTCCDSEWNRAGPDIECKIACGIHWIARPLLGGGLLDADADDERGGQLGIARGAQLAHATGRHVLDERVQCQALFVQVADLAGRSEHDGRSIVHRVVEGAARQHQPVEQCERDARSRTLAQRAQRTIGLRTVQVELIADPRVGSGQRHRLPIDAERDVSDHGFVDDGEDALALVRAALRVALELDIRARDGRMAGHDSWGGRIHGSQLARLVVYEKVPVMTNPIDQSRGARSRRVVDASAPPAADSRVQRAAQHGFDWVLDIDGSAGADAADGQPRQPLFVRIARAISAEIRRGRLPAHARLPGSRELARSLAVHRNTVLAAYRELVAEGWIEPRHGQGTFVSPQLPAIKPPRAHKLPARATEPSFHRPPALPFELPKPIEDALVLRPYPKSMLRMLGGTPDLRRLPVEALARAMRRALRRNPGLLSYADPAGHEPLRAALAGMLRITRGLVVEAGDLCVTRGSQMALALVAYALVRPGDTVVVEALGYRPAWLALRHAGATLAPIPVDEQGLCVAALAKLCEQQTVRAVYLTPHHQYPTTVPLAPGRRLQLLALAKQRRFAVIEDDYDHEFHYEGRPLLPLASADQAGTVVYVGTLSKVFAPGLRLGFVAAPQALLQEVIRRRYYMDRQGDHVLEAALTELIEDGELQRHTRRMRRLYQARRDLCVERLGVELADELEFVVPNGGMALWARAARGIDVEAWFVRAEAAGVVFQSERHFTWDGRPGSHLRLGYAALNEAELAAAVRRLRESLPPRGTQARGRGRAPSRRTSV